MLYFNVSLSTERTYCKKKNKHFKSSVEILVLVNQGPTLACIRDMNKNEVRCELKLKGNNYLLLQEGVQHVRGTAVGFLFMII